MTNLVTGILTLIQVNTNVVVNPVVQATNIVEFKTNRTETPYDPGLRLNHVFVGYGEYNRQVGNPTEKWVTTIITKEDKLVFQWRGQPKEVIHNSLVSSNTVKVRLKQEWEEVK